MVSPAGRDGVLRRKTALGGSDLATSSSRWVPHLLANLSNIGADRHVKKKKKNNIGKKKRIAHNFPKA